MDCVRWQAMRSSGERRVIGWGLTVIWKVPSRGMGEYLEGLKHGEDLWRRLGLNRECSWWEFATKR